MIIKSRKRIQKQKNIGHLIIKHKNKISVLLAVLTIIFGTTGFLKNDNDIWLSIINSIKLFGLDFPSNPENLNWYIYTSIVLVIITLTFTIALIFIKDGMERFQRYISFRNNHIAVFGLGEASVSFLKSYSKEDRKERIVIIESDPDNKKLDEYRNLGYGVLVGDSLSDSTLQLLNFKKMKYALIAMGNDGLNIELAKRIIKKYKAKGITTEIKLIVHILNPDLDTLFVQNLEDKEADKKKDEGEKSKFKIDIKTFSFFNEAAESLFEEHYIDGNSSKYVQSGKTFKTIVIGNGQLIKSVIHQIALLSHLPEENTHKVYVVDSDATNLLIEIKKYLHYSEAKFPTFKIEAVDIDKGCNEYFTHNIWNKKNLVNIIIAYDNEANNLNLAIELFNRTFKSKKTEIPKIIFAVYDQVLLSEIINNNKEAFKDFYTFGNSEKVLSYTSLIEEEKDMLAQLIHSGYIGPDNSDGNSEKVLNYKSLSVEEKTILDTHSGYIGSDNSELLHQEMTHKTGVLEKLFRNLFCETIEVDSIKAKWYNTAEYGDRLSSIAQAKHIDMKLKSMGFKRRYVFENTKDSLAVSFIGKTLNLEHKLESVGLTKRDGLIYKAKRNRVDEERQRRMIKNILLSINRELLLTRFKDDRGSKYIGRMILRSIIREEYDEKSEKECLEKLKNEGVEDIEITSFPVDFDTLFEKMIRMEHNRWIAFHYLNGWEYREVKNKTKKEHDCLIPFKDYKHKLKLKSVIFDIYSFLFLPVYLAEAGYEIVSIENCEKAE